MKKGAKTYLTDDPIQTKSEDQFDRWSFAERIAHTIGKREDSSGLVIGLYGEWGDGKTSTLNLMERELKNYDDVVVTRFNPWYFQSVPELIKGFFDHLAEAIGKAMPTIGQQTLDAVKKYGGWLAAIGSGITVFGVNVDVNAIKQSAADMAKEPSLTELRKRVEGILAKTKKRIVVLIDDIDRLDKDEVGQIFKLVRLSGNFEKITYVLAFDEKMVAAALKDKYAAANGDGGLRFVEKIIQVPLHLPPADRRALQNAVFTEIDKTLRAEDIELIERDASEIAYEFQTSLSYALRTPRQVKRYANAIMFGVPVLKHEVNVANLILIEAVRIFYPDIYTIIRDNPEAFLIGASTHGTGRDKDRAEVLESVFKGISGENQRRAMEHLLEELFPRASQYGGYGDDWERSWAEDKRICSRSYFRRYFNYGVPRGDIPDTEFKDLVSMITKSTNKRETRDHIKKFTKKYGATAVIEKLGLAELLLSKEVVHKIADGIAANGKLFKDNGDIFSSDFSRAVTFIARAHARIFTMAERDTFASEILAVASPLPFAVEEFLFMSRDPKTPEAEQTMSEEVEKKLGKELAERIAKEASKNPPYALTHGAGRLIWHWKEYSSKEVGTYLKKRLQKKPGEIGEFLAAFVGTSYGSEGKRKSDLRGNDFNSIAELVEPADVVKIIKKSPYGKKLDTSEVYFTRKLSDGQRLANQFVHIYEERQKTP